MQADYSQYAAYQMPQYGEEMHPAQDDLELIGKYIYTYLESFFGLNLP